ncbi:hypothetical protein P171DRAFT_437875 [Karstenula rhodostoma CBS 690.94]|uniref:Uncharacterized protein n=1 Tax=Karstenula rhodostoma CBS 690.94 TaxID=1392251 RepID=A0A9P4U3V3_9PLEO|nr:hypothetical protein P171DRAFT_437875 [Karstenula rhodostoma CBS 690.94]
MAYCATPTCTLPLHHVLNWSPFRIDALGIITMIGAEQVNSAIGRLVRSRYTEYLPLLGAFVFASDQFADAKSGFALYNLTAGIMTTDIAGWFSRWCMSQGFERSSSRVVWTVNDRSRRKKGCLRGPQTADGVLASIIGTVVNATLLAITILQGDWWGFANAVSMVLSVAVRAYVVQQNRNALDAAAEKALHETNSEAKIEKILVILSDARMVTMYVPANVVYRCFVSKPDLKHKRLYYNIRMVGWAGFAVQVVSLGMSGLATQLVTVSIMVMATIATHFHIGCQEEIVATRLCAAKGEFGPNRTRRKDVYAALELEGHEEESMLAWNLMPHKTTPSATSWWTSYMKDKEEYKKRRSGENTVPQHGSIHSGALKKDECMV